MSLPSQASIRAYNGESEWRFDWSCFHGDDCFERFCITVTDRGATRRFERGGAVVWSLRWLNRFFENKGLERPQGGGVRIYRDGQDYRLDLGLSSVKQEFSLKNPLVDLDSEFLRKYDGTET